MSLKRAVFVNWKCETHPTGVWKGMKLEIGNWWVETPLLRGVSFETLSKKTIAIGRILGTLDLEMPQN